MNVKKLELDVDTLEAGSAALLLMTQLLIRLREKEILDDGDFDWLAARYPPSKDDSPAASIFSTARKVIEYVPLCHREKSKP